ncbi:MAG: nickel/cobalt transporter [Egibacteraceae bacterium]
MTVSIRVWRAVVVAVLAGLSLIALAEPAVAHPLGNFTQSTYAGLYVGRDATRIDYVLDLAEIPTFQLRQRVDADRDGQIDGAEGGRYRAGECATTARGSALLVDGRRAPIRVVGSALSFPPGEAGLATTRLQCALVAETGALQGRPVIAFTDATRRDRIGWREITAVGDRTTLASSDVGSRTISDRLRTYPHQRLASPLGVTAARMVVDPTRGEAAVLPQRFGDPEAGVFGRVDELTQSFTALIQRQRLTVSFGLLAFALSVALGTLHALAPGHGKTVIAAYLVGRSGAASHAFMLGLAVAVTHTVGVLALGVLVSASQALAPERLYPVLGLVSGLLFVAVGLTLLPSALRSWRHGHGHGNGHGHGHGHGNGYGHGNGHGHGHGVSATPTAVPSWRSLVAPGLAGGIVPSPSALLVLLGGIALGRAWFGVVLVLAYGLGLAGALVGTGWLLVRARDRLERRVDAHGWVRWQRSSRALPLATACLVILGGMLIAARAVLAA